MWKLRLIRFFQRCLFFLPVRKNRILLFVNKRRGFTCNPKYVALELIRRYGNSVELIWATDYPESCEEVDKLGIRVVRAGTKQHWLAQLTSGAVVVNDAFHETVILRPQQLTVNTWHASMNYKRIGPGSIAFQGNQHRKIFSMRNVQPDVYVSGSLFFTRNTSMSLTSKSSFRREHHETIFCFSEMRPWLTRFGCGMAWETNLWRCMPPLSGRICGMIRMD